jgi:hypothetical protein
VCTENSIRIDYVTESPNLSGDDRAVLPLPGPVRLAFKSKSRLEPENAALRHQLIVLQQRVRGRIPLTNGDRLFFVQLYRWFPSVLKAIAIILPETVVRWASGRLPQVLAPEIRLRQAAGRRATFAWKGKCYVPQTIVATQRVLCWLRKQVAQQPARAGSAAGFAQRRSSHALDAAE